MRHHNLVNKQLQYTYCLTSHEIKEILSVNIISREIFLLKSHAENDTGTSSKPLFVFQISFIWGESKWSWAWFQYILIALNLGKTNKQTNKLYNTLDHWFRDMLNFFFRKALKIASSPHFVHDFARKGFLMVCSINWPYFTVWLSLLLEILDNMYIAIVC